MQLKMAIPFGAAFTLSILVCSVTATLLYDLIYKTGSVAFPIALLFSVVCGLLLGLPVLWMLSRFTKVSFMKLLAAGALTGVTLILVELLKGLYTGRTLIELMALLKSSGWVPILSAMSGVIPLWFLFFKNRD